MPSTFHPQSNFEDHLPQALDLFAGAGGLALGLKSAGFTTALSTDRWQPALDTLGANFERAATLDADASEITGAELLQAAGVTKPPAVVAGGPPCQGFSSAGSRRLGDARNTLVSHFARLVVESRPDTFLFENVEGFLTAAGGSFVIDLLDPLLEAGYNIRLRKVNVANFGVPQLRKRVIAMGVLGGDPVEPEPTSWAFGAPGVHHVGAHLDPTQTVEQALSGLAALDSADAPSDHKRTKVSELDHARASSLQQGQTMRDLPEDMWHPSFTRRASRRVSDGMPTERRGGAPAGLRRLRADAPSKAITSAASREFIHPTEDRPLTLRECARLQTFPDSFEFIGSRQDRATLIGNAVPPRFAEALGKALLESLPTTNRSTTSPGRLLTFVSTSGTGVSPALAKVNSLIADRYIGDAGKRQTQLEFQWS